MQKALRSRGVSMRSTLAAQATHSLGNGVHGGKGWNNSAAVISPAESEADG